MRTATWVALGTLIIAATPRSAAACSPPQCWVGGFVPEDGATIPANAPAVFWSPSRGEAVPSTSSVRLTTVADPATALPLSFVADTNGDWIVALDQPLVAGTQYVLEDTAECGGLTGPRVTFTAGPSAPLPTALGTVERVGTPARTELAVASVTGSCSTMVDAAVVEIELAHDAGVEPWRNLLLYETSVDGQRWSHQRAINMRTPPGQSWRGRGQDLLYRLCTPNDDVYYQGLAAGPHQVAFRARLPGVASTLATPDASITLACPGEEPDDPDVPDDPEDPNDPSDPNDPDGGCAGCGATTPAGGTLVLSMLIAMALRRSRGTRGRSHRDRASVR